MRQKARVDYEGAEMSSKLQDFFAPTHATLSACIPAHLASEGNGWREVNWDTLVAKQPLPKYGVEEIERQPGHRANSRDLLPSGLHLLMQPIMSITAPTESLDFEVLLRVRSSQETVQGSANLISTAEQSGLSMAIDRWVLTNVLEWIAKHRTALSNTRFICISLSASSYNDEYFLKEMFLIFERFKEFVPYLCIQIGQSIPLNNLASTQHFISRAHDMKVQIALENYGLGYSSFKNLRDLSVDVLKIDGDLIRTICAHPTNTAVVEAIVMLARNLGMRSIATQVENIDTLRVLTEVGVDYVQGSFVARPQEAMGIISASSSAAFTTNPAMIDFIQDTTNLSKHSSALPPLKKARYH